jgi:hypothetical protein
VVDVCVFCCHRRLKGCLFAYLDDRTLEVVEMPGLGYAFAAVWDAIVHRADSRSRLALTRCMVGC